MKKAKKVIVSVALTLFVLILISSCKIANITNSNANTSADTSWNITAKSYSDGVVSEAESTQYRVVASAEGDNLNMHAYDNDIILSGSKNAVIVALVSCKKCHQSLAYNITAEDGEKLEHFECRCYNSKLTLHFYGVS